MRRLDRLAVGPRSEQLEAGLARHAVAQRAHASAGDRERRLMLKNLTSGTGLPVTFSITFIAFGPWT